MRMKHQVAAKPLGMALYSAGACLDPRDILAAFGSQDGAKMAEYRRLDPTAVHIFDELFGTLRPDCICGCLVDVGVRIHKIYVLELLGIPHGLQNALGSRGRDR